MIDVRRRRDDEGVLSAGLSEQIEARLPAEKQVGGEVTAGQHDEIDIVVGDQVLPDLVIRRASELHEMLGDTSVVEVLHEGGGNGASLRGRLHDHRAAGCNGVGYAAGGDCVGEVPRTGNDDNSVRVPRRTLLLIVRMGLCEVRRVASEVDGFGNFGVTLMHGFPSRVCHKGECLGGLLRHDVSDGVKYCPALRPARRCPFALSGLRVADQLINRGDVRDHRPGRLLNALERVMNPCSICS